MSQTRARIAGQCFECLDSADIRDQGIPLKSDTIPLTSRADCLAIAPDALPIRSGVTRLRTDVHATAGDTTRTWVAVVRIQGGVAAIQLDCGACAAACSLHY